MADPVIQPGPYALGHSQQELDRLVFQGRFIGDLTALLFAQGYRRAEFTPP